MWLQFLIGICFIQKFGCSSIGVGWIANSNINAGQVVAVNESNPAAYLLPNTTLSKYQNYNFNGFVSVPRVVVSMIGYGQFQPSSPSLRLGFRFDITGINRTSFNYTITNYDVITFLLHYNYMAVQHEQTTFYLSIEQINFSSNDSLSNSSAAQRYQLRQVEYPQNGTFPAYLTHDIQVIVFPIGFQLEAPSSISLFSINASIINSTHYSLNISTASDTVLREIQFAVVSFDRTHITMNYSVYVDIILVQIIGNTSANLGDVVTNDTYVYRNGLSGTVHTLFLINGSQTLPNYFYYNYSSASDDLIVFRGFNYRCRDCPTNYSLYEPSTWLCHDICPSYQFIDTNLSLCLPCHYSCFSCSSPDNSFGCTGCSSGDKRKLNGSSCVCESGFFDNLTVVCEECHEDCLTCDGDTNSSCLSCNSSLFLILQNNTCVCQSGYFQNNTCLSCSSVFYGCVSCYLSALGIVCQACDSTMFLQLAPNNASCECTTGYFQDSSGNCVFNSTSEVCGNGQVSRNEQCDDGNSESGDGCSEHCRIQQGHSCLVNSSFGQQSICYYSQQIVFSLILVQKKGGENRVEVRLGVSAPNCNMNSLKQYIQQTQQLKLYQHSNRLLARNLQTWISITNKSITFNIEDQVITVIFSYNSSIDLSQRYLELAPSRSLGSSYLRYFYASPRVSIDLSVPYNNLLTPYYSQEELSVVQILSYIFYIIVAFGWILFFIALYMKKGVVGVETMLVLQMAYLTLLDQQYILESLTGLQKAGKYLLGYNIALTKQIFVPDLLAIGLDGNALNSFSIIFVLAAVSFLGLMVIMIVKTCDSQNNSEKDNSSESERVNIKGAITDMERLTEEVSLSLKCISYLFQVSLSLHILLGGTFASILVFSISPVLSYNAGLAAYYFPASTILWIVIIRNRKEWFCSSVSFFSLLNSSSFPVIAFVYYSIIHFLFILAGILMSLLRTQPLGPLLVIALFTVGGIVFICFMQLYRYKMHKRRTLLNYLVVVLLMILALVNNSSYWELGIGLPVTVPIIVLLFVALIANAVVLFWVDCRGKDGGQSPEKEMKEMVNELGQANLSYLQELGHGSGRRQDYSGRVTLLGDHLAGRVEDNFHLAVNVQNKLSELKCFKMSVVQPEVIVNELADCLEMPDFDSDDPKIGVYERSKMMIEQQVEGLPQNQKNEETPQEVVQRRQLDI